MGILIQAAPYHQHHVLIHQFMSASILCGFFILIFLFLLPLDSQELYSIIHPPCPLITWHYTY